MKFAWCIGLLILTACAGETEGDEQRRSADADRLFRETLRISRIYADSIRAASDSAAARSAFERFNAGIDSINFAVAPDTDLLLTEGENDTIYRNLMAVRRIYEDKLNALSRRHIEPADSIER